MSRSWSRHALPLALAFSLVVPSLANGQGIQPHIPLKTTLADIAALRAAYAEGFNAKDVAAVNGMFMADAVLVQADGSMASGAAAIAKMNGDGSDWPHIVITSTSVKVYGSMAEDVGTVAQHPKAGGEMVSRYVVWLRRGMTGWKVQSMAAVPVK